MYRVRGGLGLYCIAVMVISTLILRTKSFVRPWARLGLRTQGLSSGLPLAVQRSPHIGHALLLTRGMSWRQKKDDFIDVDTGISFRDDKKSTKKKDEEQGGGLLSSIGSGLAKMFGVDEKSQEKKRQRKAVSTAIDSMLKGTGVAGTLVGGVMKAAAGMLSDAFAESASDMQSVYSLITDALDGDEEISGLLGRDIRVDSTFSSSSSSMSVNGVQSRTINLSLQVSGSRESAIVQASAANSGGGLELAQLAVQLRDGRVINVVRSGGGGGGSRGPYYSPGRGKVIDVGGTVL